MGTSYIWLTQSGVLADYIVRSVIIFIIIVIIYRHRRNKLIVRRLQIKTGHRAVKRHTTKQ